MKLIDNWRAEISRLWSARLAIFGALLVAADPILEALQAQVSPKVYAVLFVAVVVARVVQQVPAPK